MSEGTLAAVYGLELDEGIKKDEFIQLCPALIQQQVSESCKAVVATTAPPTEKEEVSAAESKLYTSVPCNSNKTF